MWKSIFGAGLAVLASAAFSQPVSNAQQMLASPFHRGVNVLGYDPYWQDETKRWFEWRHFTEIRRAGFDFVRLNLQAFRHMDEHNRLDPAWVHKLDDVVHHAEQAGLGLLIDEHDFDACSKDVELCRTKLSAFWQQIAPRFAKSNC